jgi:PHD/YefM family antitoxin component YafN of YafNO toxin-antitoxin module
MVYTKINQASKPQDPAVIFSKRNTAILVAKKDSPAVQETLYLLAITGMRKSIQDAMAEPLAESKRILKW